MHDTTSSVSACPAAAAAMSSLDALGGKAFVCVPKMRQMKLKPPPPTPTPNHATKVHDAACTSAKRYCSYLACQPSRSPRLRACTPRSPWECTASETLREWGIVITTGLPWSYLLCVLPIPYHLHNSYCTSCARSNIG